MDISVMEATVRLDGDFDVRSTWLVRRAIHDLLRGHEVVVVDLSKVRSVDHTALKVLAFASQRARREGRAVKLRGCGPAVLRMLLFSRLIRLVEREGAGQHLRPIA